MPHYRNVRDMDLDEVSVVDRPANQHAAILITKRADDEESDVPETNQVEEVGIDDLQVGDVVLDQDDNPVEVTEELLADLYADAGVREPELVGKSASLVDSVLHDLSKALENGDTHEAISKVAEENATLRQEVAKFQELAKAEQDLRLEREYTARAAEYGLPVDPAELGPVLKRAAEYLPYEDCVVLNKAFEAAGEQSANLFQEIGKQGMGSNPDPFGIVEALVDVSQPVAKADGSQFSQAEMIAKAFADNPAAYDEYERQQRALRG